MTKEEEEAKRKAEEEEAKRKAEEEENSEEELTAEELKAKLAEKDRRIRELNRESAERRKKLEALEKTEAERKQAELTEVEKATAKAKTLEEQNAKLVTENRTLKLHRKADDIVADLGMTFVDPKAREDAYAHLDSEEIGEDFSGLEGAVKTLLEDRSYLFQENEPVESIDATDKGKVSRTAARREAVKNKKRTGLYSGI